MHHFSPPARPAKARVPLEESVVWRFYTDPEQHWKWQRLSVWGEVISESTTSHQNYEGCLTDAQGSGYLTSM